MALIEAIAALTIVATVGVIVYETIDPGQIKTDTQTVANAVTCRTLVSAAAGYYADNNAVAMDVTALAPYYSTPINLIGRYTVTNGHVSGPGCA